MTALISMATATAEEWILDMVNDPPHSWLTDPREPVFTFMWNGQLMGFYLMSLSFWAEMVTIMLFEGLIAAFCSFLVYKFIIPNQRSTTAYLLGYGIMIPFWCIFPAQAIQSLGIKNKLYRFAMSAVTPSLSVFRTTEAMHGFAPLQALQSPSTYMGYFALPMVARYDKSTKEYVKATNDYIFWGFLEALGAYVYTGALYSVYNLFPDYLPEIGGPYEPGYFRLSQILTLRSLRDSAFWVLLFEATLGTSGIGGNFISTLITGYEMEPYMQNVWRSRSASDFWNRKWNKLIQTILSRGIYKPCRSIFNRYVALFATFLVSGLFHEWLMSVIFAPLPEHFNEDGECKPPKCFQLTHGSAVVFFAWIGFLIACEFLFLPKSISKRPHLWYQIFISLVGVVPDVYFCDPYVHTTFFNEGFMGYFMVAKVGIA